MLYIEKTQFIYIDHGSHTPQAKNESESKKSLIIFVTINKCKSSSCIDYLNHCIVRMVTANLTESRECLVCGSLP